MDLICVLSQTFSKLDCLFCLTFADEGFNVLIVWIDGELVRHVEGMCLILRDCFQESLADLLYLFGLASLKSVHACRALLLPIVDEAAIS